MTQKSPREPTADYLETIKVNINGQTIENDAFDETKKWASNLIDQITRSDNPSTVTLVQVHFYEFYSYDSYRL